MIDKKERRKKDRKEGRKEGKKEGTENYILNLPICTQSKNYLLQFHLIHGGYIPRPLKIVDSTNPVHTMFLSYT